MARVVDPDDQAAFRLSLFASIPSILPRRLSTASIAALNSSPRSRNSVLVSASSLSLPFFQIPDHHEAVLNNVAGRPCNPVRRYGSRAIDSCPEPAIHSIRALSRLYVLSNIRYCDPSFEPNSQCLALCNSLRATVLIHLGQIDICRRSLDLLRHNSQEGRHI
jgi:hypothetical protein